MYRKNKKGQFSKVPFVYKVLEHSEQKPRRYSKKVMLGMFLAIAPWMIAGEAYVSLAGVSDKIYLVNKQNKTITQEAPQEPAPTKPLTLEDKIKASFPEEPHIAIAVAKGESGLHTRAVGYNCRYGNISQSCRPEDRHKAWSVDCGLYQINVQGQSCPDHLFEPEKNIETARKLYEKRGWTPWVAWKNGQWKNHL